MTRCDLALSDALFQTVALMFPLLCAILVLQLTYYCSGTESVNAKKVAIVSIDQEKATVHRGSTLYPYH
jgi:hypothetical protein